MKVWNLNKLSGVLGVFNCQGAGTWPLKDNSLETPSPEVLCGQVSPNDVEFLEEIAGDNWHAEYALYAFNAGKLLL